MLDEEWRYRTEQCTVPPGVLGKTHRLFTAEVSGGGGVGIRGLLAG